MGLSDWVVGLQERPEYADGRAAWRRGDPAAYPFGLTGDAREAWRLGWTDARDNALPRPGEP